MIASFRHRACQSGHRTPMAKEAKPNWGALHRLGEKRGGAVK